jgi:hypothetical protein
MRCRGIVDESEWLRFTPVTTPASDNGDEPMRIEVVAPVEQATAREFAELRDTFGIGVDDTVVVAL